MAPKSTPRSLDVDLGEAPADLMGAVVSGVRWKSLTRVVAVATRAIVVVVLAHVLTPTEYGIAGMAIVAASFGLLLTDPALGSALIQRPAIDERDRSTAFWLASGIGLLLTVLGIALSGLVAGFFGVQQVQELFAVCSLCFVVVSLSVVHRALLARRLAYRSLEIRDMVGIVAGGVVAVAVALAGFGPWAVIMNLVASTLVSTVLVWVLLDWRPHAVFSLESARNLGGFSGRVFAASALSWGDQNVDKGLVGRVIGAEALGAYSLAFAAMLLPQTTLGRPFNQVLAPALSRIQTDKDRLERAWLRSKRLSVAVVAPAVLGLIVLAPDFVPVAFGDQWNDAIIPLQLLCIGGVAASLVNLHTAILVARGEGSTLLRLTFWSSMVRWASIVIGLPWGIVGVAASYAVVRWLLVVPSTWFTTRAVSFSFLAALRAGTGSLPAAVAAAAVGFGVRQVLLQIDTPQAARLIIAAGAMLVAYAAILMTTSPFLIHEMLRLVRKKSTA